MPSSTVPFLRMMLTGTLVPSLETANSRTTSTSSKEYGAVSANLVASDCPVALLQRDTKRGAQIGAHGIERVAVWQRRDLADRSRIRQWQQPLRLALMIEDADLARPADSVAHQEMRTQHRQACAHLKSDVALRHHDLGLAQRQRRKRRPAASGPCRSARRRATPRRSRRPGSNRPRRSCPRRSASWTTPSGLST